MSQNIEDMTTGDIIVDKLIKWGVDVIFGIIGGGINPLINSLYKRRDEIKFVTVRHEETAALIASGYSKYSGKLAACVATTGPGMLQLINGLYDGATDGAAMIALTGMYDASLIKTLAPQDIKTFDLVNQVAVYDVMINGPKHALKVMDHACIMAYSKSSLSHVTIPTDIQNIKLKDDYHKFDIDPRGSNISLNHFLVPDLKLIQDAADLINNYINQRKKILILMGRGCKYSTELILDLAKRMSAPICKSLYALPYIPNENPYIIGLTGFIGSKQMYLAMKECDLLFIAASSMPFEEYYPDVGQAKCIQIDKDPRRIGLRYPSTIGIMGDVKFVLSELIPMINQNHHNQFLTLSQNRTQKWDRIMHRLEQDNSMPLKPEFVISKLNKYIEPNANIAVDTGEHAVFTARHLLFKPTNNFIFSGGLQTMGCGLPYAIGSKFVAPEKQSVAIVGDGGFAMLMGDITTAVKHKLDIKIIILKNDSLALEHNEQQNEGFTPYGYELESINFAQVAIACGAEGYIIRHPNDIDIVFQKAFHSKNPSIIQVDIDPNHHSVISNKVELD